MVFKVEVIASSPATVNAKAMERVLDEFTNLLRSVGCRIVYSNIQEQVSVWREANPEQEDNRMKGRDG